MENEPITSNRSRSRSTDEHMANAVQILVADSLEEACLPEGKSTQSYDEVVERLLPQGHIPLKGLLRPLQTGTCAITGFALRSSGAVARGIVQSGQFPFKAARATVYATTNGIETVTNRAPVQAFLEEAEDEGRRLMSGLAGLAGFGRINQSP